MMILRRLLSSLPLMLAVTAVAVYTTACCCCPVPSTPSAELLRETRSMEVAPKLVAEASTAQAH